MRKIQASKIPFRKSLAQQSSLSPHPPPLSQPPSLLSLLLLSLLLLFLLVTNTEGSHHLHVEQNDAYDYYENSNNGLNVILVANPTTINIFWDAVDNATDYYIEWSEVDTGDGGNETVDETASFYTIESLTACTDYLVSVEAMKDEEQLDIEEHSTETKAQAPFSVSGLQVTPLNDEPILKVTWTPVSNSGNCNITYKVSWQSSSSTGEEGTVNTTEAYYDITGLSYYNEYYVCVTSLAEGKPAEPKCVTETTATGIPGPPQNVCVSNSTTTESLVVQWDPPVITNGLITNYSITWSPDDPREPIITNNATYNVTDLHPCTSYTINVSAATSRGSGPPSDTSGITQAVALQAPRNLTESDHTQNSITVKWIAPPDEPNCVVMHYLLRWSDTMEPMSLSPTTYTYTITNLTPSTTYTISVAAENEAGKGLAAVLEASTSSEKAVKVWIIVGSTLAGLLMLTLMLVAGVSMYHKKKVNKSPKRNTYIRRRDDMDLYRVRSSSYEYENYT